MFFSCGFGVEMAVLGVLRPLTGETNLSWVTSGVWALPKSKVVASASMVTCTGESRACLSAGFLYTLSGVPQGAGVSREDTKRSLVSSGVLTAEKSKLVMLMELMEVLAEDEDGELRRARRSRWDGEVRGVAFTLPLGDGTAVSP